MKSKKYTATSQVVALAFCVFASACGKAGASFVTGVNASTTTSSSGDQMVSLDVNLNTVNLVLPSVDLPIDSGAGSVSLVSGTGGTSQFVVSVDVSKLAHITGSDGHFLPNGLPIPIGNVANIPVTEVQAGSSTFYFSLSDTELMMGVAIPIKELGNLGNIFGGLNYFPAFTFSKVDGVAGIYTGSANGIAFFLDASSLLPKSTLQTNGVVAKAESAKSTSAMTFKGVQPSAHTQLKIQQSLYNLGKSQHGVPLTVE